jgi:hypothetical protein
VNLFDYLAHTSEQSRALIKDPDIQKMRRAMLMIIGPLLLAGSGAALVAASFDKTKTHSETSGHLWWKHTTTTQVPVQGTGAMLLGGIFLLLLAAALTAFEIRWNAKRAALRRYPAILTGIESIKVQKLAGITGNSTAKVYADVQRLIESGTIEDFYVDFEGEQIVSKKYVPKTSHKTVAECSSCGQRNELIVGITRHCASCGQPLILPNFLADAPAPPPMSDVKAGTPWA